MVKKLRKFVLGLVAALMVVSAYIASQKNVFAGESLKNRAVLSGGANRLKDIINKKRDLKVQVVTDDVKVKKETKGQIENFCKSDSDLCESFGFELPDLSNRKDVSRLEFYDGNKLVGAINFDKVKN